MASIIEEISNLINGVSQQAPSLRFPSQAETQENGLSVIGGGLKKRPPMEYVAKLYENIDDLAAIHTIDRDANERYKVIITSNQFDSSFANDFSKADLKIFDLETGVEQTVSGFQDGGYLSSNNARDTFVFLTVADTSFIINKNTTVLKDTQLDSDRAPEGIVFLKAATATSALRIFINGSQRANASNASSETLVNEWETDMNSSGIFARFDHLKTNSSNIWLTRNDGANFTLHATGPEANVIAFKETAPDIGSLPITTKDGFTIELIGETGSSADNLWIRHSNANDQSTGEWIETVKPGLANTIDPTTMPVKLIRNPAEAFDAVFSEDFGTPNFSLNEITWNKRVTGDTKTNPDPSFIGQKINDIFFYKNRLGLLAGENIILSELSEFFNFYFTTLTTLPATDPIDIAAPSNRVSILKSAIPFNEGLILFSDNSQFSVKEGTTGLTPESVSLSEVSQYKHEPTTKPILVGRKIYYGETKDGFSTIREFGLIEDIGEETAEDITAHIPFYIDGSIRRIFSSVADNMLFVQSSEALNELAVYVYLWERGQKVISSWSKWILPEGESWLEVHVIDSVAFAVIKRSDGTHEIKISLQSAQLFDEDFDISKEIAFKPLIDYSSSSLGVYDVINDITLWTVPYSESSLKGVHDFGWGEDSGTLVDGLTITTGFIDSWDDALSDDFGGSGVYSSIEKTGDYRTSTITFGRSYTLLYEFTEPHITRDTKTGVQSVKGDRLLIRDWAVEYENTSSFTLRVEAEGRGSRDYLFSGRQLGSPSNQFGTGIIFESGTFRKLVLSKNTKLKISIIQEDHTPATFLSAFWTGEYFSRARNRRI